MALLIIGKPIEASSYKLQGLSQRRILGQRLRDTVCAYFSTDTPERSFLLISVEPINDFAAAQRPSLLHHDRVGAPQLGSSIPAGVFIKVERCAGVADEHSLGTIPDRFE